MHLTQTRAALRRQLDAPEAQSSYRRGRKRHPVLNRYPTISSVLKALSGSAPPERYAEREALVGALIDRHQKRHHPLWQSILLVAFYPMLSRIAGGFDDKLTPRDGVDQLTLTAFLTAIAEVEVDDVSRICLRLRQLVRRRVRQVIEADEREHEHVEHMPYEDLVEQSPACFPIADHEESLDAEDMAQAILDEARRRLSPEDVHLIVATTMGGQTLREVHLHHQKKHGSSGKPTSYEALRRRRAKALRVFRAIAERRFPTLAES